MNTLIFGFTLLVIVFMFIAVITVVYYTLRLGISPMPSSSKVKSAIESSLPKQIEGKIYELGCGWGTIAFRLATLHPEAEVHAFEVSPLPWMFSYFRHKISPHDNLKLYWEDFFRVSLEDGDIIVCYLYPGAMERLKKKFEKELKPGTIVVSNTFAVPGWKPDQVLKIPDIYRTNVYVYKI